MSDYDPNRSFRILINQELGLPPSADSGDTVAMIRALRTQRGAQPCITKDDKTLLVSALRIGGDSDTAAILEGIYKYREAHDRFQNALNDALGFPASRPLDEAMARVKELVKDGASVPVAANMTRAIHQTLNSIEKCPRMYGSPEAVELQYRMLLLILGAGFGVSQDALHDTLRRVTTSRVGGGPTASLSGRSVTEEEFITGLKEWRAEVEKLLAP